MYSSEHIRVAVTHTNDFKEVKQSGKEVEVEKWDSDTGFGGLEEKLEEEMEVMKVDVVSERIIKVTVRMEGEIMDIIQVYAPQTGCTDDEKREFEEDLERQVKEERTIIIGDFNAQVGKFRQGYEEEQGI
ncbi:hypothetical protein J6590_064340 [Homalodisca vitripennis]|nr:hypothetical protein J6590_064340 [Homalodisca vitripennis]